jgi:Domain of unknown function (DUF1918)
MRVPSSSRPKLAPGDAVVVRRRHQGQIDPCERSAVVLELPHRCPWPCRVRWDDNGLEELLYPRDDLVIARRSGDDSPDGHDAAGSVTTS